MTNKYGICALCGKACKLTYEHIPPKKAFNSKPAKSYPGDKILFDNKRLPWDVEGLKYMNLQQGSGKYSLCEECNNNTGAWYANTYKEIAYVVAQAILKSREEPIHGIEIEGVYGVRFIKQIISMFCSVNSHSYLQRHINQKIEGYDEAKSQLGKTIIKTKNGLKNAALIMEELRSFVINKDSVGIDKSKFKICMYVTDSQISKFSGITAAIEFNSNSFVVLSEITSWPFGFILYFNPDENLDFIGVDITELSNLEYDDKVNIEFPFEVKEMNTVLPLDYRSKDEIKLAAKNSDIIGELQ